MKYLPLLWVTLSTITAAAAPSAWVYYDASNHLAYQAWGNGNQIMDFSSAGYMGGGVALPTIATVQTLNPSGGDDTAALQSAINAVAARPLVNGSRGALQLGPGTFNVSSQININASGVVVRGSGSGAGGTLILMTNAASFTLFNIVGSGSPSTSGKVSITDGYVPSGTTTIDVSSTAGYSVGNTVLIGRTVTSNWVHYVGMDTLVRSGVTQTWISVGTVITTDRTIKQINGNQITLDAPLTDSFDTNYLGIPAGTMSHYTFSGRISQVGLEHLQIVAPPVITGYTAINLDSIIDSWVRDVAVQDGVNNINVNGNGKRITLDSVVITHTVVQTASAAPTDFACTGTQVLFNKCQSYGTGSWPFLTRAQGTGPIVFLYCYSTQDRGVSPHERWTTGILADNCQLPHARSGNSEEGVAYGNRGTDGSGHGWTTGWSVGWNVISPYVLADAAPGSENWCIGCVAAQGSSSDPHGIYESLGTNVALGVTGSLYLEQLRQRLGDQALINIGYGGSDFTIAAAPPTGTVLVGGATNFNVTLGVLNGFNSNVVLSVTGLPVNTGFNFNPPFLAGAGNATLTISTSNSTPAGVYPLQIIGTSSGLTHTSAVSLVVMNFSLSASPASQSVGAGSNTSYTVTAATNSGFAGAITFGLGGLPANTGFSFVPPTLSGNGTTTLNVTTTSNAPGGNFTLTIFGTNGSAVASTTVNLTISSLTAAPGMLLWTAASGQDQNWSTVLNWTNVTAGGFGPPGANNSVLFTNLAAVAASALTSPGSGVVIPGNINSFIGASFNILGLTNLANTVNISPTYHNLAISGGATLAAGGLQVGNFTQIPLPDGSVVNLSVSGAGATLVVTNGGATVSENSTNSGANNATLDLSALDNFFLNGTQIRIGVEGGSGFRHASGIVYLAKTNTLTLSSAGYSDPSGSGSPSSGNPALYLGHNGSAFGSGSQLYLGLANTLFLDYATIGRGDTNALLAFNPAFLGSGPFVQVRGISGGSSRVGVYVVGDGSAGAAANNAPSTNDFSGGTVDAMINYLCVGRGRSGSSSTIGGSGVLTLDQGTINANALAVGFVYASGSNSPASGIVNVNGNATLVVNSNLTLGSLAATAGGVLDIGIGTLNVNGGTVSANSILSGGTASVTVNNGTIAPANTLGTITRALDTLNLTNAFLHFTLDGNAVATNVVVTNLNVGGVTLITIDSLANVNPFVTNRFPLVQYAALNGSVTANFDLDDLPGIFVGYLTNNIAARRIDLVLTPPSISIPTITAARFSAVDGSIMLSGTNGSAGATYFVLGTTNLALPPASWTVVGSDVFDTNGNFNFSVYPDPGTPGEFYRLQLQ